MSTLTGVVVPVVTATVELLGLGGAGAGFLLKSRANARRDHVRTEEAAAAAAEKTRAQMEERNSKLETQLAGEHEHAMSGLREKIASLEADKRAQQARIDTLVDQLIRRNAGAPND